jgi:hypothetical protein
MKNYILVKFEEEQEINLHEIIETKAKKIKRHAFLNSTIASDVIAIHDRSSYMD